MAEPGSLRPGSATLTTLELLRDLIARTSGVFYNEQRLDLLEERLGELTAARGLSLLDYYYLLRYDPQAGDAWHELMDRLAVPETYFWRQPEQFVALLEHILPRWEREHPGEPLRVWSAACCSGEEPLSIALGLAEQGWFERIPIEVVGSDASEALLARARGGVYRERALRALSPARRARWFSREAQGWRIDPGLHARVRWVRANLLDPAEAAPLAAAQVVFCRNVFIYFADEAIARVARTLAAHMPEPSWLFLGASESLMRLPTDFTMDELGPAFVYVRKPGTGQAAPPPAIRSAAIPTGSWRE